MFDPASYVEFALDHAREDVSHHRSVLTMATVIDSQGEMVLIGARNIQTDEGREGWIAQINLKVAELRAQAVVLTAGVIRGEYSEQGRKKFRELEEMGIHLRLESSAALGLCEKVDAIMVTLYTPLQTVMTLQNYRYVNGKVVFGKVETVDDNAEGRQFLGLFANFFNRDKAKATHPS